jgi:hypothetical protein
MEMSEASTDEKEDELTIEQWLQIRKEEALRIDPDTAEAWWIYANVCDPYGVYQDLTEEEFQIGRVYFARSPESDIWVWFGDLPRDAKDKLWNRPEAFSEDLSFLDDM